MTCFFFNKIKTTEFNLIFNDKAATTNKPEDFDLFTLEIKITFCEHNHCKWVLSTMFQMTHSKAV